MDKLSYLKSSKQRFRDLWRLPRYSRQAPYEDKLAKIIPGKPMTFAHDWKTLAHMHDLRVWTITYAP